MKKRYSKNTKIIFGAFLILVIFFVMFDAHLTGAVWWRRSAEKCISDSDGGINEFIRGSVDLGPRKVPKVDSCQMLTYSDPKRAVGGIFDTETCEVGEVLGGGISRIITCYVNEGYCDENNNYKIKRVKCESGRCHDGECIISSSICKDSDDGDNPYIKGNVSFNGKNYEDECMGNSLKEYYCEKWYSKSKIIDCFSCSLGVCKPKCDTKTKYPVADTICSSSWPTDEGNIVNINVPTRSCNLFEVCDDKLDYIIDDAIDCCENKKNDEICKFALENSDGNLKKCKGLYIIKGLGNGAKYMKGYFASEFCCDSNELCKDKSLYGKCQQPSDLGSSYYKSYVNENAEKLSCWQGYPENIWGSDKDMSKNSCYFLELPAHASLNILQTGTCADYSIALTTLLRKVGYFSNEVMSVTGVRHVYNLIKFPGDDKYHIVDTTGNRPSNINLHSLPSFYTGRNINKRVDVEGMGDMHLIGPIFYDYCNLIYLKECFNDKGQFNCPKLSQVYGCGIIRKFPLTRCSWNLKILRGTCDKCWYEELNPEIVKGCCKIKKWSISYTKCIEFSLSEMDISV